MSALDKVIRTDGPVRLVGRWAWLTTLIGVADALTLVITIILGLPYGYRTVTQPCSSRCALGQLTPTNIADLQKIGISLDTFALVYIIVFVFFTLICLTTAGLLLWKKPGELLPFCAAMFILFLPAIEGQFIFFSSLFSDYPFLGSLLNYLSLPGSCITAYLFLTFPNGKFRGGIFWWLFIALGVSPTLVTFYIDLFDPNIYQDPNTLSLPVAVPLTFLAIAVSFFQEKNYTLRNIGKYLLYILLCLLAILVNNFGNPYAFFVYLAALVYREVKVLTPRERNSAKWLVYGFSVFVGMLMLFYLVIPKFPLFFEPGTYYFILFSFLGFFGCGINLIGTLMAVLYANAFDINLVIKRTLVYTALSVVIVAIYLGSVIGLQQLVRNLTGQSSDLAIVGATLVAALLFQPLRHAIQGFVDRRFYRHKYDTARTITRFAAELQNETDLQTLSRQLHQVLSDTLEPEQVAIWLKKPVETKKP